MARGSRIPEDFRRKVSFRIRKTMKGHVADGKWAEFEAVGNEIGVSAQAVYYWYEGLTLPSLYNLVKWAEVYDVSLDYILGRKLYQELAA